MAATRADYGRDAPVVFRRLLLGGIALAALAAAVRAAGYPRIGLAAGAGGAWLLLVATLMFAASRYGKFRLRDKLLSRFIWRGDEQVLDVGCGHGLLLIGAAKRLTAGRAIGIDIWSQIDQADNSAAATCANAKIEGVADRVEVRDGDARNIEFPPDTFDIVVSSLALHNIPTDNERARAIHEIVRVLKPGGAVGIVDIWKISQCWRLFRALKLERVRLSWPSFWFVVPSFILTARKPG